MDIYDNIFESIYEASFVSELWPQALDGMASLGEALGGIIFTLAPTPGTLPGAMPTRPPKWTSSPSLASHFQAFIEGGWLERNSRAERIVSLNHAGFVNDFDLLSREEIDADPMYAFLRTLGLGWCAGLTIHSPSGDTLIFCLERPDADGPVSRDIIDRLNPLRPHLARAALTSTRLGLEKAHAATAALAALDLPAALVSASHKLIGANDLFQALIPSVVEERASGLFQLVYAPAEALLANALAAAPLNRSGSGGAARVMSIPIVSSGDQPAMIVHLVPIRRVTSEIFTGAMALMFVTTVTPATIPSSNILQELFDLSAAEARVAHEIAAGGTIKAIAKRYGKSEGTLRVQLKSIFTKTGVSRQAELTGLLSGAYPFRKIP